MKIKIIPCLNDNYSYLIHDEISNTVAIVDPSEFIPCDAIISKNYKDVIHNTYFQKRILENDAFIIGDFSTNFLNTIH